MDECTRGFGSDENDIPWYIMSRVYSERRILVCGGGNDGEGNMRRGSRLDGKRGLLGTSGRERDVLTDEVELVPIIPRAWWLYSTRRSGYPIHTNVRLFVMGSRWHESMIGRG